MENLVLQHIAASPNQILFWKDCDFVYAGCNEAFAKLAGLSTSAEIVGLTDFDLPWRQKEAKQFRQDDQVAIAHDQPFLEIHETITCTDGTTINSFGSKSAILDHGKEPQGVLGQFALQHRRSTSQVLALIHPDTIDVLLQAHRLQLNDTGRIIKISKREAETLLYVMVGYTNKEIAHVMSISPRTTECHLNSLKIKFDCHNRGSLVRRAHQLRFLSLFL